MINLIKALLGKSIWYIVALIVVLGLYTYINNLKRDISDHLQVIQTLHRDLEEKDKFYKAKMKTEKFKVKYITKKVYIEKKIKRETKDEINNHTKYSTRFYL